MDTQDPKWQANPNYKPSKLDTWNHPASDSGWMHAHNCIRGEIRDIDEALVSLDQKFGSSTTSALPSWTISILQKVWNEHEMHVRSHHGNEDDMVVPYMKRRVNLPDKYTDDHLQIVKSMKQVSNAIENLNNKEEEGKHQSPYSSSTSRTIREVRDKLLTYEKIIQQHFEEEETIALPLLMAYFTPKEFLINIVMKFKTTNAEKGSFVYYLSPESFRNKFMKQEGIPGFLWSLDFKYKYRYFLKNVKEPLDALKIGVEPVPKQKKFLCLPMKS